jgi:hypothetical protein
VLTVRTEATPATPTLPTKATIVLDSPARPVAISDLATMTATHTTEGEEAVPIPDTSEYTTRMAHHPKVDMRTRI